MFIYDNVAYYYYQLAILPPMQMARTRSTPSPFFYFLLFFLLAYIQMISCEEEATIATSTPVCITDNQQLCTRLDRVERQLRLISASQLEAQGWTLYNLHWYRLFEVELTWSAAENYCRVYGGHLPSIHDVAENDFIHQLRKSNVLSTRVGRSLVRSFVSGKQILFLEAKMFGFKNQLYCLRKIYIVILRHASNNNYFPLSRLFT